MLKPNLVLAALLIGLSACASSQGSAPSPSPSPSLTSAEQAQLAQLEARPLKLPAPGADGSCPSTPMTSVKPYKNQDSTLELYGSGPVYGAGGPTSSSVKHSYYYVTYVAGPTVRGVVLARIETLDRLHQGVFYGKYTAGPIVGTDKVNGQTVELYGELALPVARPSSKAEQAYEWQTDLAPGWVAWHVHQGVDASWKCVAIQIDSDAGTEVIVIAG